MAVVLAYMAACYIIGDAATRKRLRRDWWLFIVMPGYRFVLFWFRFGSFLAVLMEPAEWRVKDPVRETAEGIARLKSSLKRCFSARPSDEMDI